MSKDSQRPLHYVLHRYNRPIHFVTHKSETGLRIVSNRSPTLAFVFSSSRIVKRPSYSVPDKYTQEALDVCPTKIQRGLYILSYRNPQRPSHLVPKEPQRGLHILSQKNPREVFAFCLKGTPKIRGLHILSQRSPKSAYTFFPKGTKAAPKRASCSVPKEPQRRLYILSQKGFQRWLPILSNVNPSAPHSVSQTVLHKMLNKI